MIEHKQGMKEAVEAMCIECSGNNVCKNKECHLFPYRPSMSVQPKLYINIEGVTPSEKVNKPDIELYIGADKLNKV
jgi:hypothetical protein